MKLDSLLPELRCAVNAAHDKKASQVTVLDLTGLGAFTNYFLLCTGFSSRQVVTIGDEIEHQLGELGWKMEHREGRGETEWVLLDFGSFLVHIFTERARHYYDLERLWRSANRIVIPDLEPPLDSAMEQGAAQA